MQLGNITAGLRSLATNEQYCERAIRNLTQWWDGARYVLFRPQLEGLVAAKKWALLLDSFYRMIPFGTGGRRGPVGIGPNRMNQDTVVTSVQGHVNYLRRRFHAKALRVVVAFDVRVFRDLRGLYDPALPNPLLGISSRDFARLAAGVYALNGVEVYTVPGDGDYFLSTPELSFAIRHLQADGGLNISASHNHPDDNGAKFYMPSGGQPVPPDDEELANEVESVGEVSVIGFDEAVRSGRIKWWDAELHTQYLDENLARSIDPSARRACIVYTPLHGTGRHTVGDVLPRAGFDMRLVEVQAQADGSFPAVKFHIPNPEVPESMELVTAEAQRLAADAGLATDPDADRLGVVAPAEDGWRPLGGNEIATLLTAYIIEARRARGTLPAHGFVIKTAVTTELMTRIAAANRVQMLGDLLVGFKYVGHALDAIAARGQFRHLHGTPSDFLFAAEESNGGLASAALRDKDAAGCALLLAELCARLRAEGRTLGGYLDDVYRRYGYAANTAYSLVMEGITGLDLVTRLMDRLRAAAPASLAGQALRRTIDYWNEQEFGTLRSETDRSARNFIQLHYDGGLHVSVRPSGTEPKIKFYVEQLFEPQPSWANHGFRAARGAMDEATRRITLSVVDHVLRLVNIQLPPAALLLSSLVSLDNRLDFANRFLPEFEERLQRTMAGDSGRLVQWVDQRLRGYGSDPRYLVAAAARDHFATRQLSAAQQELLEAVFP